LGRGSEEPSRESFLTLVGNHGEASADYIHRCHILKKVARVFAKGRKNKIFQERWEKGKSGLAGRLLPVWLPTQAKQGKRLARAGTVRALFRL
jgi:hypothetical protein